MVILLMQYNYVFHRPEIETRVHYRVFTITLEEGEESLRSEAGLVILLFHKDAPY